MLLYFYRFNPSMPQGLIIAIFQMVISQYDKSILLVIFKEEMLIKILQILYIMFSLSIDRSNCNIYNDTGYGFNLEC